MTQLLLFVQVPLWTHLWKGLTAHLISSLIHEIRFTKRPGSRPENWWLHPEILTASHSILIKLIYLGIVSAWIDCWMMMSYFSFPLFSFRTVLFAWTMTTFWNQPNWPRLEAAPSFTWNRPEEPTRTAASCILKSKWVTWPVAVIEWQTVYTSLISTPEPIYQS